MYRKHENPYLFIFWISYCLYHSGGIYAPMFKTSVTTFNEKDWGYNEVGLLDEVFKSYLYFREVLGDRKMVNILLRFSIMHSYRYSINWRKPARLLKQFRYLAKKMPKMVSLLIGYFPIGPSLAMGI